VCVCQCQMESAVAGDVPHLCVPVSPFMNVCCGSSHSTLGVYPDPCVSAAAMSTWMSRPSPLLSMSAYLPRHRDRPWLLSPTRVRRRTTAPDAGSICASCDGPRLCSTAMRTGESPAAGAPADGHDGQQASVFTCSCTVNRRSSRAVLILAAWSSHTVPWPVSARYTCAWGGVVSTWYTLRVAHTHAAWQHTLSPQRIMSCVNRLGSRTSRRRAPDCVSSSKAASTAPSGTRQL
jgi:hypothetical protein